MRTGLFYVTTLGIALAVNPIHAAPLPNGTHELTYTVVDQDLTGVLTGLAEQVGLRINISTAIQGRVRGRMPPSTAQEMLDHLATLYGFDWYCDGHTLYVSSFSEATTKVLPLGMVSAAELLRTLAELDIADSRWPIRVAGSRDVIIVNGPPGYVRLVDQALAALAQRQKTGTATVSVFRGSAAGGSL